MQVGEGCAGAPQCGDHLVELDALQVRRAGHRDHGARAGRRRLRLLPPSRDSCHPIGGSAPHGFTSHQVVEALEVVDVASDHGHPVDECRGIDDSISEGGRTSVGMHSLGEQHSMFALVDGDR